jgi:hypothetical protein
VPQLPKRSAIQRTIKLTQPDPQRKHEFRNTIRGEADTPRPLAPYQSDATDPERPSAGQTLCVARLLFDQLVSTQQKHLGDGKLPDARRQVLYVPTYEVAR